MALVDLRSDTVTRPTAAMRQAMATAEVGDDVYGEDPTVNALQDAFATRVGMAAALFVPSGTMGNQLALRLLGRPGTAVLAGARQHIVIYENGAAGLNTGVQLVGLEDGDGTLSPDAVAYAIEAGDHHSIRPSLVCVENTHLPAGGTPYPIESLRSLRRVVDAGGLALHMDGARLFHAEVATDTTASEYCAFATTVMCCLSKALGAPVGSLLAGSADLIASAREERQRLGGGMRQAGVLAAAGLVALETMVGRLADDHARARRLAEAVVERYGENAGLDPATVVTNIVNFSHPEPDRLLQHLRTEGVLAGTIAPRVVRFVTHFDVDEDGLDRAAKALATAP